MAIADAIVVRQYVWRKQSLSQLEPDNRNVHRAAAKIIVFKSRAARSSVCNVLFKKAAARRSFLDWFNR